MKFNTKTPRIKNVMTYEGAEAYSYQDPRNELVAAVATTFLEDKYYESSAERMDRVKNLVYQVLERGQFTFLFNLLYITRHEWHLRSISHLLAGILVGATKYRKEYPDDAAEMLSSTWIRPDDMSHTVAYWVKHINGGLNTKQGGKEGFPYLLSRAINHRFNTMSMFQAAKYHQLGTQFSLYNLLRISRPTAVNQEQNAVFQAIIGHYKQQKKGEISEVTLPTDENWRAYLDKLIGQGVDHKLAFEAVMDKMGLFALINNLNTFDRHGVEDRKVISRFTREAVIRSKLLPFRFMTAMEQVTYTPYRGVLKQALEDSFVNLVLPANRKYLVAVDTSGSMHGRPVDIASTFGAILARKAEDDPSNTVHLVAFATDLQRVDTFDMGVFALKEKIIRTEVGHGTNGHLVYRYAKREDTPAFDYVIVLTDIQYHYMFNEQPPHDMIVVNANLQGYRNTQTPFSRQANVVEVANISEKIFDYLEIITDPEGMISYIESYRPSLQ
ncbi:MAG: TROVE domain-containing protein [Candidatus Heimdallarchaeota archaeon]|nr:TROVE domain-containing protein [Candidatus Heimdallarchaeota archaeon]